MPKWIGNLGSGSLPDQIKIRMEERSKRTLERLGLPGSVIKTIVDELVDEVSFSFAGREHKLQLDGAGRPPDGPAILLSVNVADLLQKHNIRGNWVDLSWAGKTGPVAELEAIAQTAFREACDKQGGVMARPARISKARK